MYSYLHPEKLHLLVESKDYKVVEIIKYNFNAITILSNEEINKIEELQIEIKITELNKNVA